MSAFIYAEPPITAAVFDFQVSGKEFEHKGAEAGALLYAQLSAAPGIVLVERQEIEKLLGEQELGLSGEVSPDTAAKVGNLTGAKVLVTGRVFSEGGNRHVVAKIIGVETSRVFAESATFSDAAAFGKALESLAPKIAAVIEKRAGDLVAKIEAPTARMERWKKIVAGRKLPSVAVKIAEQHLGRRTIDPAAQTEMTVALQQLGFVVIDPKESIQPADVTISGEAFSELGMRKGNLVFSRARLETKAVRTATGALLHVDRQTDAGIDLAEHTAAKTALENAAQKVLERILPKLVAE